MDFLKELFTEPLSFEAFQKAVQAKGIKLANLSDGKYVDKVKLDNALNDLKEEKATVTNLTGELKTLKDNNASADEWKNKFEKLQNDIAEKEKADKQAKADAELTAAIEGVFGDKKFTSDYVKNGIIADMKSEIAKSENKGKGYAEIFDALTKDKDGIFENANPPAGMTGMGNGGGTGKADSITEALQQYYNKN